MNDNNQPNQPNSPRKISDADLEQIAGGRIKLPSSTPRGSVLTSADGSPVSVYVDGVKVNSVITG